MNAVDFNIYLEDEGKVMTSLTNELRTLTAEIEQKLTEVKDGVEIGNVQVRQELKHSEEELRKVYKFMF